MACLSAIVRETYMHLFAEHDYLNDWSEQIGATTNPLIVAISSQRASLKALIFLLMARTTHTTEEPVIPEGFQAIMKPSQYGHTLSAIVPES